MLEVPECSEVKKHQNCHNFAPDHLAGTVSALFAVIRQDLEFFELFCKFFAETVHNTENFNNFIVG
jgi:hypothetical protein